MMRKAGCGRMVEGEESAEDALNKDATNGAKCIATRSKDATRGSWPYY